MGQLIYLIESDPSLLRIPWDILDKENSMSYNKKIKNLEVHKLFQFDPSSLSH